MNRVGIIILALFVLGIDITLYPYVCDVLDSIIEVGTIINGTPEGITLIFYRALPFVLIFGILFAFIYKLIHRNNDNVQQ